MPTLIYQITMDGIATGYVYSSIFDMHSKTIQLEMAYPDSIIDYLTIEL